jgi:hypothetical protein
MYLANTLQAECYVYILSLTGNAGRSSRVLLADVILWINKACLVLYIACTTDLKFGSCTVMLSLSPVIEASKLVTSTVEVENWSQTPSL